MKWVLWAASVAALASPSRAHGETPDPWSVQIAGVRYAGIGCPEGTDEAALAADLRTLSVNFSLFDVTGQGAPRVRQSKTCAVDLVLLVPPRWSLTVTGMDAEGRADLARGTAASLVTSFGIKGRPTRVELGRSALRGTLGEDFVLTSAVSGDRQVWSACEGHQQTLRFATTVAVLGDGLIAASTDGPGLRHRYALAWQRCEPPPPAPDEVVAVAVPHGIWDGDLYLCVNFRNGVATTHQIGSRYPGMTDVTMEVTTVDGRTESFSIAGPAPTSVQLSGDWRRLVDGHGEVTSWVRLGRGDDPGTSSYDNGSKRCLRLIDGAGVRPGPVEFTAAWGFLRDE